MHTPLIPWDAPDGTDHPDIVWRSQLDQRYLIEVRRTGPSKADLVIFDHGDGDKELKCWSVGLAYGARFGPDVGDVAEWQDKIIDFIDNQPSSE